MNSSRHPRPPIGVFSTFEPSCLSSVLLDQQMDFNSGRRARISSTEANGRVLRPCRTPFRSSPIFSCIM
jgi:hypothetical protein